MSVARACVLFSGVDLQCIKILKKKKSDSDLAKGLGEQASKRRLRLLLVHQWAHV